MTGTSTGGRGGLHRGRGCSRLTLSPWTWLSAVSCVNAAVVSIGWGAMAVQAGMNWGVSTGTVVSSTNSFRT